MQPIVERRQPLTHDEIARYSRHLIIPEIGMEGQERLKAARVLIVGTGGLGSPLALYLAAAGVGTIGLVDADVVDRSNLHRQIIHGESDIGRRKVTSARETIAEINPHVDVREHELYLTSDNALEVIADYDLVVDGTDNFPTRYLVNDACVLLGKPNVYGSIFRFEGQVAVFYAEAGPCYRCMFPEPPPPGMVPNCAEGGVFGLLCGTIGSAQGTEALKLITGIGEPLTSALSLYDALDARWTTVKVSKDPDCPVCGDDPTVTELIDYEEFCGVPAHDREEVVDTLADLEWLPEEFEERRDEVVLLDVREPHEFDISRIPGSVLIPLGQLPERLRDLDQNAAYVVHCKTGPRSLQATQLLRDAGFKAWNLRGGINAYARQVDDSIPVY